MPLSKNDAEREKQERDHALILVPDIDHAVETLVAAVECEPLQQIVPIGTQTAKGLLDLLYRVKPRHEFAGRSLVDDTLRLPLLLLRILDIAESEDEVAALARFQADLERECDAIGLHPWATELRERPSSTASGSSKPL